MNALSTPQDSAARLRALEPSCSFIVSAPAGSGKTGLLTQRVLKLLARCEQPEDVLAITFTRKAAQEMRQRIVAALQAAHRQQAPSSAHESLTFELARAVLARDCELGWNLLLMPQRLRIQTIDSFCQSIVNQQPFNTDLACFQQATETPDHLYRQAIHAFFAILQSDSPLREDLERLLLHLDNNLATVEKLLVGMLQQRNQWLGTLLATRDQTESRYQLQASLAAVIEDTLARSKRALHHWLPELTELCCYAGANIAADDPDHAMACLQAFDANASTNLADLPLWQGVAHLLLTNSGTWRSRFTKSEGFPPKNNKDPKPEATKHRMQSLVAELKQDSALLDLINDVKALPAPNIDGQQWQLLDSLTRLLPRLVAEFVITCQSTGECDFNTVAYAALSALGDCENPSELALKLDYRLQHILVDEFQDTSLPQLQLLERLTAGWQDGDGRTLFVVGDAMQSCYGFRDANVSIFLGAQSRGIGQIHLEALELTVNFRSDGAIVQWVNATYPQVFPSHNDIARGAIRYQRADHFFPVTAHAGVRIEALVDSPPSAEARRVVEIVREALARDDDGSIAILVRNRSHLGDILTALRAAGIAWQANAVDRLANRMAVIDLLSLTRALTDFSDRIAWLAILRAPWCGLDMHDLHRLATHGIEREAAHRFPLLWHQIQYHRHLSLSEAGEQAVGRLHKILNESLRQRGRKPLRQWIEGTWLALGGPAAVSNPVEQHATEDFFKLLERHDEAGAIADWNRFDDDLNRLFDSSSTPSRLHVMTIHKAKGLEFDTVIIPGLTRTPRNDDNELLLWHDYFDSSGRAHLLLSPVSETGKSDALYGYLKREKTIRQRLEAARLLYIGCTRAIRHLHLLMTVKRDEKSGDIKPPGQNTLASPMWEAVQSEIEFVETHATPIAERDTRLAHILRLPPDFSVAPIAVDDTLQAYRPSASFADNAAPQADALFNRRARHAGTVLHQALHDITVGGVDQWSARQMQSRQEQWRAHLRQLGLAGEAVATALATINRGVEQTLADATGRWLLDHRHRNSHCELSLLSPRHDGREFIIDRLFVEGDTLWLVDYKSSEPAPGQSLADFLTQECEHYRAQLQNYLDLVKHWDRLAGLPQLHPKAALYFPLLQHFEVVVE